MFFHSSHFVEKLLGECIILLDFVYLTFFSSNYHSMIFLGIRLVNLTFKHCP